MKFFKFILIAIFALIIIGYGTWFSIALFYQGFLPLKWLLIGLWSLFALFCLLGVFKAAGRTRSILSFLIAMVLSLGWWTFGITPKLNRDWKPEVARTVTADIDGSLITLNNVRNFDWTTSDDFVEKWEDRTYDLDQLESIDLFASHWGSEAISHSIMSFRFTDGERIAFSVEIRKEQHESFSTIGGFFKQYELAIIAADENDIIRVRTNARDPIEDVYLYPLKTTMERRKALFLGYIEKANADAKKARFYNTITANCTTVVYTLIKSYRDTVPLDWRILASGYLPDLLSEMDELNWMKPHGDIRARAAITDKAQGILAGQNYSELIRK
ncbi:DUF4105 domain-containing protein [Amylibacter sp. SFDW26]|uniref:Lnb N-terminal periplasmic domain-containing protein n=1 Tax=Amylibacter sp. SFDW26 TaxID=2652722 RepID=UPI001261F762|nr:DUF4105 domain-containing protein [Amylibacter sp. SFDW26]KAB7615644.1 DUF4105 domain-containing protein [Amylibacter sp. SFDW26]